MADPADWYTAGLTGPRKDVLIRASDADRHATVLVLQDAVARGLLTPDEGGERMATAYAAVHVPDLHPLTADLGQPPTMSNKPPGWRVLATMAVEQVRFCLSDKHSGQLNRGRVIVAFLLAVVLVLSVGFLTAQLFDGGPRPGPGGFVHH